MKTYREICADLIVMLEDLEESLNAISKVTEISEQPTALKQPQVNNAEPESQLEPRI